MKLLSLIVAVLACASSLKAQCTTTANMIELAKVDNGLIVEVTLSNSEAFQLYSDATCENIEYWMDYNLVETFYGFSETEDCRLLLSDTPNSTDIEIWSDSGAGVWISVSGPTFSAELIHVDEEGFVVSQMRCHCRNGSGTCSKDDCDLNRVCTGGLCAYD